MSNVVRKTSNINAIAITGSSGKTSLKELLAQTLKKIVSTCYSKNSFNNKYGVPLSLFNINKQNILGVFEIGMDKKGEIQKLAKLVNPDLGIITNISYAHIKNFRNLNEIAQAKSELIDEIVKNGTIVLNRDDHYFNFFKNKAIKRKLKIITFSKKNNANVKYIKTISQKEKSIIILKVYNQNISLQIQKKMEPYIDNLLASVAIISNYFEIKKLNKNIFNNFILPKGRGDIKKIKVKNKYLNIIVES